jgi:hypothetical protein
VTASDGFNGTAAGPARLFMFIPLALLLPGLLLALKLTTGTSVMDRPLPYLAISCGLLIFFLIILPLPDLMSGDDIPDTNLNWRDEEDLEVHWTASLFEYYLTQHEIGPIGIVIQFCMATAALAVGGLWSLVRPAEFGRAFGFEGAQDGAPPPPGREMNERPDLKVYE